MTDEECGETLCSWMSQMCNPENVKNVAISIGYNDSPIFFATKKKIALMEEVIILNTAIVIDTVNSMLPNRAKSVIDTFLLFSKKSIFDVLHQKDSSFKALYETRIAQYFKELANEKPMQGMTVLFMNSLGVNPHKNIQEQINMCNKLSEFFNSCAKCIKTSKMVTHTPVAMFENEINNWPKEQSKRAVMIIQAAVIGDQGSIEKLMNELTSEQANVVRTALKHMAEESNK